MSVFPWLSETCGIRASAASPLALRYRGAPPDLRHAAFLCVAIAIGGCSDEPLALGDETLTGWRPGQALASDPAQGPRGMLDLRGLIHAHTVYSHDACDGAPRNEQTDAINLPCLEDFRRDLCAAGHDFAMLTDHGDSFNRTSFAEALLHRGEKGDELIERDGNAHANWLRCDDAERRSLILGGTENGTLAVGLEGHVAATEEARRAVYREATPEAIGTLKEHGAVVLAQHTEDWTVEQLSTLPFDGFEMYNLHANTLTGADGVVSIAMLLNDRMDELPQSDLVFLPIINEDPRYLDTWARVAASGARRVTTIGTDCHRNSFASELPDGERVDSYRRMMVWMSNHLLVASTERGSFDDRSLKDALRAGRLFGVFEVFGYPEGFDYHGDEAGEIYEMGAEAPLGTTLIASAPRVRELAESGAQPGITMRLLRATSEGWQLEVESEGDLQHTPDKAGAYRLEVRITPHHLERHLSSFSALASESFPWIYSNPVYLRNASSVGAGQGDLNE